MQAMLAIAVKAARAAGHVINRASLDVDALRITRKQVNDFVTEVDQQAEQTIIDTLLQAYPGHGIWAEESGRTHGTGKSEFVWIIDPLDGTTNFIHGLPIYCVSIALAHRGVLQHAVVYDPARNDLFTASRGHGAFCNNRRIRVSTRLRLADGLIGTGFPIRPGPTRERYLRVFPQLLEASGGVRRPGAAALDLAYVAAGWYDGFCELGLHPWDVAAGALLVQEAGGLVGNWRGEADFLEAGEIVAGTPRVYGELVRLLAPHAGAPAQALAGGAARAEPPATQAASENTAAPAAADLAARLTESALAAWDAAQASVVDEPAAANDADVADAPAAAAAPAAASAPAAPAARPTLKLAARKPPAEPPLPDAADTGRRAPASGYDAPGARRRPPSKPPADAPQRAPARDGHQGRYGGRGAAPGGPASGGARPPGAYKSGSGPKGGPRGTGAHGGGAYGGRGQGSGPDSGGAYGGKPKGGYPRGPGAGAGRSNSGGARGAAPQAPAPAAGKSAAARPASPAQQRLAQRGGIKRARRSSTDE